MSSLDSLPPVQLQAALARLLDQQLQRYDRIAQWSLQLPDLFRQGLDPERTLQAIRAEMVEVQRLDQSHQTLREHWLQLGHRPDAALQQRIDQVQQRLLELMETVDRAEREAQAACERLRPQVGEAARRNQMLRAYQPSAPPD